MSQTCLNCGSLVKSKYCPEWGQKSDIGRINMHALLHEFWHGFTHTDKGVLRLWLDLLLRPRRTYTTVLAQYFIDYILYQHLSGDKRTLAIKGKKDEHIVAPTFWEAVEEVFNTGGGYNPFAY